MKVLKFLEFPFVQSAVYNKTPVKHRDVFHDTAIAKKVKYGEREDQACDLVAGKHEKISSTCPSSNPRPTGWESNK